MEEEKYKLESFKLVQIKWIQPFKLESFIDYEPGTIIGIWLILFR